MGRRFHFAERLGKAVEPPFAQHACNHSSNAEGWYPGQRGISSRVTDTSKNALNRTGRLQHSTLITALEHYTRAQKQSIAAAMKTMSRKRWRL
jgi:hypothetical protein